MGRIRHVNGDFEFIRCTVVLASKALPVDAAEWCHHMFLLACGASACLLACGACACASIVSLFPSGAGLDCLQGTGKHFPLQRGVGGGVVCVYLQQ